MAKQNTKKTKSDAAVPKIALRRKEVAHALGISVRKVDELKAGNLIPYFHVGTAVLYPVDGMRKWVEDQMEKKGNK